jgi:ATP-binding cassette subfamily F protein 3
VYFAQHQIEQLRADDSPLSFLRRQEPNTPERALRSFLGGFAFVGDMALAPIGPFSGGEKARLVLAAIIRQKPNLLLLDEPTNHLDLEMRHALGVALQGFEGALVLVSHDRHLLHSVCDSLKLIHDGKVDDYSGDLDDYARWLLQSRNVTGKSDSGVKSTENSVKLKRDRKRREALHRNRSSHLNSEIRRLEKSLQATEQSLAEVEAGLADNTLYEAGRKDELIEMLQQQVVYKQQIDSEELRWLDVTEQLEMLKKSNAPGSA